MLCQHFRTTRLTRHRRRNIGVTCPPKLRDFNINPVGVAWKVKSLWCPPPLWSESFRRQLYEYVGRTYYWVFHKNCQFQIRKFILEILVVKCCTFRYTENQTCAMEKNQGPRPSMSCIKYTIQDPRFPRSHVRYTFQDPGFPRSHDKYKFQDPESLRSHNLESPRSHKYTFQDLESPRSHDK